MRATSVGSSHTHSTSAYVVVAESDTDLRHTYARLLTHPGRTVEVVAGMAPALDHLDLARVDVLVVTDTAGLEEAARLLDAARHRSPETLRLLLLAPVVPDDRRAALGALAHRVLVRPFQVESLQAEVYALEATSQHVRSVVGSTSEADLQAALLQECLDDGLLFYAAQPIVRAQGGGQTALELLLRSRHARLNNPMAVIEAAERCRRVALLGAALNRLVGVGIAALPPEPLLFVNVHPAQFADPDVVESFRPLVPHAHRVVLEITERARLGEFRDADAALEALTALGFRIAVDDLGSGFNSLAVLAELQPAFIKVDMSIVRGVHLDTRRQRLLQLLASFASATGAEIVAEGVETEDEAAAARACGVHLLQGYLFGKPSPSWFAHAVS
jgi:EAL domain-containing protein (putative c-di-GMP-specific phosphodiesterase class I)